MRHVNALKVCGLVLATLLMIPISSTSPLSPSQLAFEINHGQTDEQVNFLARGHGYQLFLTPTEAVLSLTSKTALHIRPLNANPHPLISGANELTSKRHYYRGNEWQRNISTYGKVEYRDLYPGIDLIYYGKGGELEYDFIVAPHADPSQIRLSFEGAESIEIDSTGNLILKTVEGEITHRAPHVYQESGGARRTIDSRYLLHHNHVAFELGEYNHNQPLIIDPALLYSTYLGGGGVDEGRAITIDGAGNYYVTGGTLSVDFPGENGQLSPPSGDPTRTSIENNPSDVFISKFDSAGNLLFSAYLGSDGTWGDVGNGIAVDANGLIYVTGYADAGFTTLFPLTGGAYDTSPNGNTDAFAAILENDGSALRYSTLLGGGNGDRGEGIAVDGAGDLYITGHTYKHNATPFPIKNAAQPAAGGGYDAFVAKITPHGNGAGDLVYSTYLGGSGTDKAMAIAIDTAGAAYVTGVTYSTNFPLSSALQGVPGGSGDAFVAKVATDGGSFIHSTYLGGSGADEGRAIAVDGDGLYITGKTESGDFPVTPGAYDGALAGTADAFIVKLNSGGALDYSTYLGGSGADEGRAIALDASGDPYVTGVTGSSDFPVINTNVQSSFGGASDAFITRLNATGSGLDFAALLGGENDDAGEGVAVAGSGIYLTGWTRSSSTFPLSTDANQAILGGGGDAFVARLGSAADLEVTLSDNDPVALGAVVTYTIVVTNNGPDGATEAALNFTPTQGLTHIANNGGCSAVGSLYSCPLGTLAAGAQASIAIEMRIETTATQGVAVTVSARESDPVPANNSANESTIAQSTTGNSGNGQINVGGGGTPPASSSSGGGGATGLIEGLLLLCCWPLLCRGVASDMRGEVNDPATDGGNPDVCGGR